MTKKKSLRKYFKKRIETGQVRTMTDGEIYQLCPHTVHVDHRKLIVKFPHSDRDVVDNLQAIEWCEETCCHMWGLYPRSELIFRFQSADEAALFKLTWG